ncbi:dihydroneopterin aldolase [Mariprofundus sp. KV]|uniref:dihydroneopterin aldolase n=1 Tax=Mariprofundus sp. KV TaxID=2608715 RepID=UPI0015A3F194|nr:dihydroneopterin aldolase [Mariprofundus sp. KV]
MSVKDLVLIEGLEIRTVIGIYDWEREIRQTVRLDLEMAWDISRAAASDNIEDALDYKSVSKRLISFVEGSSFGLIEKLAEQCAQILMNEFAVPWLRLKMSKPGAVRGTENVAVLIERGCID